MGGKIKKQINEKRNLKENKTIDKQRSFSIEVKKNEDRRYVNCTTKKKEKKKKKKNKIKKVQLKIFEDKKGYSKERRR